MGVTWAPKGRRKRGTCTPDAHPLFPCIHERRLFTDPPPSLLPKTVKNYFVAKQVARVVFFSNKKLQGGFNRQAVRSHIFLTSNPLRILTKSPSQMLTKSFHGVLWVA